MSNRRAMISTTQYPNLAWQANSGAAALTMPLIAALELTTNFTVTLWAKMPNFTGTPVIIGKAATSTGDYQYALRGDPGTSKIFYYAQNTALTLFTQNRPAVLNTWMYIAFGMDAGTMFLNVDGSIDTPKVVTGTHRTLPTTPNRVGHNTAVANGMIVDEVRYYNIVKTPAEILANKFTRLNGNETGLVGYYKMNGSGKNWADSTGATADATNTSGSFVTDVPY